MLASWSPSWVSDRLPPLIMNHTMCPLSIKRITLMISPKTAIRSDLLLFLGAIGAMIICGFIFIYSSSSIYALERFGIAHYFVKKQLLGFIIGLIGLILAYLAPLKII